MDAQKFIISPHLLSGLSGLIPGEKSPLSPLNVPNPPELTSDQRAELVQLGMFDENGLVESARLLLAALSEVTSFARLRVNSPSGYLDEAIHFTAEGAQTIGISNTPDGLALATPGDPDAILNQLCEYTGNSVHAASEWSVELPPLEMLALAALLDLRRKAVLRAILEQQPVVPPPGDPQSIASAISAMWTSTQWLTASIQAAANLSTPPAAPVVQASLLSLADKELAYLQEGSFLPVPEVIAVIDRFLLIGTVLTLDVGNTNLQGRYALARHSWLQAGVSEMLHLTRGAETLQLEVVSPEAALNQLRFFLTTFDAQAAPPVESIPLAVVIQAGMGMGESFPLEAETVMGRSEQAGVRILDVRASRRHAVIRKLTQGYQLSDAGSTNGTYLNGQFLTTPAWLHEGDLIGIGETQIKVIRASELPSAVEDERTVFASAAAAARPASAPAPAIINLPPPPLHDPFTSPASPSGQSDVPDSALSELQGGGTAPDGEPLPPAIQPQPPVPPFTEALPEVPQAEVRLCARCQEPLQPGDTVCRNCGLPVEPPPAQPAPPPPPPPAPAVPAICPNCGSATNPGARFCGACGYQLLH